jgi:PAS domain S-box-containing protein
LGRPAKSPQPKPASSVSDLLLQARSEPDVMAERLALAMDAAGGGVFVTDRVAGTFWCSEQFVRVMGRRLTTEEALGQLWPIHHPDDIPQVMEAIEAARAAGGDAVGADVAFEARVLLPEGGDRWVEWRVKTHRGADGVARGVVGTVFDIDARKHQEAALLQARREAEANAGRLNLAMRASGGGVFDVDYEHGTYSCSPEFEEIVGRKMAFADIAKPVWSFTHPDDMKRVLQHIATHRGDLMEPCEWRVVLPSGDVRWVRSNGYLHIAPGGDRPLRVVGFIQDIDERKRQELVLEEAHKRQEVMANRLKVSVDAAGAGVFEIDLAEQTFWSSPEFADIIGRPLTYEEASGTWPICHPDDLETVQAITSQPRKDGEISRMEWRIIRPNGEVRWIDSRWLIHRGPDGQLTKVTG